MFSEVMTLFLLETFVFSIPNPLWSALAAPNEFESHMWNVQLPNNLCTAIKQCRKFSFGWFYIDRSRKWQWHSILLLLWTGRLKSKYDEGYYGLDVFSQLQQHSIAATDEIDQRPTCQLSVDNDVKMGWNCYWVNRFGSTLLGTYPTHSSDCFMAYRMERCVCRIAKFVNFLRKTTKSLA